MYMYVDLSTRGKAGRGEKAFRDSFARLGELRSIVKQGKYGSCETHYHDPLFSLLLKKKHLSHHHLSYKESL